MAKVSDSKVVYECWFIVFISVYPFEILNHVIRRLNTRSVSKKPMND